MFVVHPKKFAIVKTDFEPRNFLAIVKMGENLTAVVPEEELCEEIFEYEKGFRLITILKPLSSETLRGLAVFTISTDSVDLVLVREENLDKVLEVLKDEIRKLQG